MVIGLELFAEYFAAHREEYVLIGGTAATLAMHERSLPFRATKDLDVVLCVGTFSSQFQRKLWTFIAEGGYGSYATDNEQRPRLHRFSKPATPGFPLLLEFFATHEFPAPTDGRATLTKVAFDGSIPDLSAIALSAEVFDFILAGRRFTESGIPFVGEDRLIPLKAAAWADLTRRRALDPTSVDAKDITKHRGDVFKLAQLLQLAQRVELPAVLQLAVVELLAEAESDAAFDTTKLSGLRAEKADLIDAIRTVFSS